jgi:hypothetical protein
MTSPENGIEPDPDSLPLSPSQRLALSRERMREAMKPPSPRDRSAGVNDHPSLLYRLRALPGVALLVDVVETWWARHPMHTAALLAGQASRAVVAPIARRNPLRLVLLAFAVGAALAWVRPWRWIIRPALFAGLLPQLVSRVVASVPSSSWLALLASVGAAGDRPDSSPEADGQEL